MHSKIVLFVIILLIGGFFYIHTTNPAEVGLLLPGDNNFTVPVTVLLFAGFVLGVVLMILNTIVTDAKKMVGDMRGRKEKKLVDKALKNYTEGTEALFKGDYGDGVKLLEKSLLHGIGDRLFRRAATLNLAEAYGKAGESVKGLQLLEDFAPGAATGGDIEALFALASLARAANDLKAADRALLEVLKVDDSNPRALIELRDLKVDLCVWAKAAEFQKRLMDSGRAKDSGGEEMLAAYYYEDAVVSYSDDRLSDADLGAKNALGADPSFMPARLLLAKVMTKQSKTAEAIELLRKGFESYRDPEYILELEEIYIADSKPDMIISAYKEALIREPGRDVLRLLQARLHLRLEMVDNAIEELEDIEEREGKQGRYRDVLLAEAYFRRKQGKRSAALFKKAFALDKEFSPSFECSRCAMGLHYWAPRCENCSTWNSFAISGVPTSGDGVKGSRATVINIKRRESDDALTGSGVTAKGQDLGGSSK